MNADVQGTIGNDPDNQGDLSTEVDIRTTTSNTWQDGVFKIAQGMPQWREDFMDAYPYYTSIAERGKTRLVNSIIDPLASSVAAFLSACVNQGLVNVDKGLLREDICSERLKELQLNKRNELLGQLSDVLQDPSEIGQAAWTGKVTELMNDTFFLPQSDQGVESSSEEQESDVQKKATIAAWAIPYEGTLHEELWNHISRLYKAQVKHRDQYANMCAIIQSSGTGKSRMVDQLGIEHLVIPICLRDPATNGFPPADDRVRLYLSGSMKFTSGTPGKQSKWDESYAINRIAAFFQAFFVIAKEKIEKIICDISPGDANNPDVYRKVSAKFRHLMTDGQSFKAPNTYRMKFYDAVVDKAEDLIRQDSTGSRKLEEPVIACDELVQKLKLLNPSSKLVFVIAFDESAMLTTQNDDGKPPILNTLRKCLNTLNAYPFFSLFLSTTGRISPFLSPFGLPDGSTRIVQGKKKLNPAFTGCIFDGFDTEDIVFNEGRMTVQKAASEWTMMHLGRPLWVTRVDKWRSEDIASGDISIDSMPGSQSSSDTGNHDARAKFLVRRDAMSFAVAKLLNWTAINNKWQIDDEQMIACLCHRLPIEFQSASPFQYKYVENHMRICVRLDPEDQTMISMSSSEPVLSEASFVVMKNCVEKILPAMKIILGGFSVAKGDRGELVALLILLLARDEAVSKRNADDMWKNPRLQDAPTSSDELLLRYPVEPKLIEWNRVFSVPDFLRALFGELKDKEVQEDIDRVFKDTRMHFNHFIKCFNQSVLKRQYLAGLFMRGAALLCANYQRAVDAAIPFSFDDEINRFSEGNILCQMKNIEKSSGSPQWTLFDAMEQCRLGIVEETTKYPPDVVRIVFDLAAPKPSITSRVEEVTAGGKRYIAVDIWCAGISNDILPCIQGIWKAGDTQANWNSLLACYHGWETPYIPPGESEAKDFLRRMTPCLGKDEPFWKFSHDITVKKENTTQRKLGGVAKLPPRRVKRKT